MHLARFADDLARCTACGACRSGCPTFDVSLEEGMSGRGRVQLAKRLHDGTLAPSARMAELFDTCTRCNYCTSICPVGLPALAMIDAARADLREARSAGFRERLLFRGLLPRRWALDGIVRLAAMLQRVLGRSARAKIEPLPLIGSTKRLPRLPWVSALRRLAGTRPANPQGVTVSLFVGCRTNYFYPEVAADVVFLLERAGARVSVPGKQVCSGTVARGSGDTAAAERLAATNVSVFGAEGASRVATTCGSCLTSLRSHGPEAGVAPATRSADWATILRDLGWRGPFFAPALPGPVIVHETCQYRWLPGQALAVHDLLRLAGVDATRLVGPTCCGGAAPFAVAHGAFSRELGDAAIAAVRAAGTRTLVTGDPGCLLQFRDALQAHADLRHVEVIHSATALRRLVTAAHG